MNTVAILSAITMKITRANPAAYTLAFGAGMISFLSPCVLPIVPGYLSLITGLDVAELRESSRKHRLSIVRDTGLFIGGFTLVFVLLELTWFSLTDALFENQVLLTRLSGALVTAMALFMLGSLFLQAPWLYQEKRFHPRLGRFGRLAPMVAGVAFGFGWSPCLSPVLGDVLLLARNEHRAAAGISLLIVYSLGLGLPFLVTGLAFGRLTGVLAWAKRHTRAIVLVSSLIFLCMGILLMFDRLSWLSAKIRELMESVGLDGLLEKTG